MTDLKKVSDKCRPHSQLSMSDMEEFESSLNAQCCGHCHFFIEFERPAWSDGTGGFVVPVWKGECRRHCPTTVVTATDAVDIGDAVWPVVSGEFGWCGEFEQQ